MQGPPGAADVACWFRRVVTPQQYHEACHSFIGYELHRFQIIVAEMFEYMIANILDRGVPSFTLRPRTTSGTALYMTEHGPIVVLEGTTDVSQQSEIQTYYTLQTSRQCVVMREEACVAGLHVI